MTTKHTPATPLPWIADARALIARDNYTFAIVGNPATEVVDDQSDARYIAHACNAYPRLVEAVRELLDWADSKDQRVISIRAILRELGEDA